MHAREFFSRHRSERGEGGSSRAPEHVREYAAIRESGGINAILIHPKYLAQPGQSGVEKFQIAVAVLSGFPLPSRLVATGVSVCCRRKSLHVNHNGLGPNLIEAHLRGSLDHVAAVTVEGEEQGQR